MIYLFGCSYVDNNFEQEWAWPQRMARFYESRNFGAHGSGPDYSLKQIKEVIKSGIVDKNKDLMIFFVPEYFRSNFRFLKTNEQVLTYSLTEGTTVHKFLEKKLKNIKEDDKKWTKDWYYNYLMYDDNANMHIQKIYAMINSYASSFDRVLVMPTDGYHRNPHVNNVEDMLTAPNITFVDVILDRVSNGEGDISEFLNNKGIDLRPQHLSKENHELMYYLLKNWIDGKVAPHDCFKYTKNE